METESQPSNEVPPLTPSSSHPINRWPVRERPRERLIESGVEVLSEAELLAVLLRSGVRGKDALQLGREMLHTFGGLRGLLAAGHADLRKIKGLGPAKIATLLAAAEMARRQLRSEILGRNAVRDPQAILDYLSLSLRDRNREVFKVLFLNKGNCIVHEADLFEGTIDDHALHIPRQKMTR